LNGTTGYVKIAHNTVLNLSGNWTIEAWVKQSSNDSQQPIIRKGNTTTHPAYYLYGHNKEIFFYDYKPYGGYYYSAADNSSEFSTATSIPKLNEWYHLALVKSGTNLRVFYNGVLEETKSVTNNPRTTTENLFFGSRRSGTPSYFGGLIDEIRISSIARYATSFTPLKRFTTDATTIGLWNFEETAGTVAYDSSGNNLNGTLKGGVEWVEECVDSYTVPDPDPDPVTVFSDNFENGIANWTLNGDWEIGEPYFSSPGMCVITEAYSGHNVMATNLTGNYAKTKIMDAVTANPLTLPDSGKITLEFMAYVWTDYEKSDGSVTKWYDGMTLLYKEGANNPVELVVTSGNPSLIGTFEAYNPATSSYTTKTGVRGHSIENTYSRFTVNISHLSGKTVNFIFRYASDPLVRDTDIGIYIDDVTITAE